MKLNLRKSARAPRALHGHPWVFDNELDQAPGKEWDGKALPLYSDRGKFVGTGLYNSNSKIAWRSISREEVEWNKSFLETRIRNAILKRDEEDYRRLIWSEADYLPGLIVDQFGPYLVVQSVSAGVDAVFKTILDILQDFIAPDDILVRNDAPSRRKEGLPIETYTVSGQKAIPQFWAEIYQMNYWLDLNEGQKTGFYLDQRQEHFKVGTMSPEWRVLDCFCNQGAFALHAAKAGASEVVAIDSSSEAIALGEKNAKKNGLKVDFRCGNVFDYFTENRAERFDLIVLDPPSFAPNRKSVPGALRGYKELHLRAFKQLNSGGILATYCCSHHVSREEFLSNIRKAALDAKKDVQVLYSTGQPLDHPIRLNFPESEYLKGFILRLD